MRDQPSNLNQNLKSRKTTAVDRTTTVVGTVVGPTSISEVPAVMAAQAPGVLVAAVPGVLVQVPGVLVAAELAVLVQVPGVLAAEAAVVAVLAAAADANNRNRMVFRQ